MEHATAEDPTLCTSMQTRTHTLTLRLTRVSYFGRNLPHQLPQLLGSSWEAGIPLERFSREGLDLSRGRKSDVKPTCPMHAQPSVRPLRATREASPAHLPPSCRAPSQPDGHLVYGFGLQSLYRLFYFLKILQYSAVLERHVSSSYAKLITCHFRCQVQKVFRRRVKRTWLGEETELALCVKLKWADRPPPIPTQVVFFPSATEPYNGWNPTGNVGEIPWN